MSAPPRQPSIYLAAIFRCAGVYLVFQTIAGLPLLSAQLEHAPSSLITIAFSSVGLFILGAIFFIVFAKPLARLCGGEVAEEIPPDLLVTGIRLIGLYFAATSLADLAYNLFQVRYESQDNSTLTLTQLESFPYAISSAVSLALGAFLLLRAILVARWLRSRSNTTDSDTTDTDTDTSSNS